MFENMTEQQAREQILGIVDNYCRKYHNQEKNILKRETEFLYASRSFMIQKKMVNLCGQCAGILADSRQICR